MQPDIIRSQSVAIPAERLKVLRSTYLMLSLTMIPTFIGAMVGLSTTGFIMRHPIMSSLVMIGAIIGIQFAIAKNRNNGLGVALLLGMTFILGWWLGPLLNIALSLRNGPQLIGIAAIGTGGILLAMSLIATTTKRDFSFMGKTLFVGMIVVFLMMLANMFFQIPALAMAISAVIIVIFSLFILHDVSKIINGGETNYIMAATGVYISLYNIFVSLLHLLMAFAGNRE